MATSDPSDLRASDADREQVAARLRTALDEGRLNLHEYDERLRDAFAARTYAELNVLLADLPGASQVVPVPPGAPVPGPDGRYPGATRRWLAGHWVPWAGPVAICIAIWGATSVAAGEALSFWPFWVAVPWGAVLAVRTVAGLASGEPQRDAAREARKAAEREIRRASKERRSITK